MARPEPIKLEAREAGYEVRRCAARRDAVRCDTVRAPCSGRGGRVFTQCSSGSGHLSGRAAKLRRKTFSFILRKTEVVNVQLICVARIKQSTLNLARQQRPQMDGNQNPKIDQRVFLLLKCAILLVCLTVISWKNFSNLDINKPAIKSKMTEATLQS